MSFTFIFIERAQRMAYLSAIVSNMRANIYCQFKVL